jgi:predicted DNA binding CopG/RHH family protein
MPRPERTNPERTNEDSRRIFARFLAEAAERGEVVNILFKERLFDLVGCCTKSQSCSRPKAFRIELIGGLAFFVHVEEADPTHSTSTRDVDLMVRREDLERIKQTAAKNGFVTLGLSPYFTFFIQAKIGPDTVWSGVSIENTSDMWLSPFS